MNIIQMPSKQEQVALQVLRGRTLSCVDIEMVLSQEGLQLNRVHVYDLMQSLERKELVQRRNQARKKGVAQAYCHTLLGAAVTDFIVQWGIETILETLKYSRTG